MKFAITIIAFASALAFSASAQQPPTNDEWAARLQAVRSQRIAESDQAAVQMADNALKTAEIDKLKKEIEALKKDAAACKPKVEEKKP